MEFYNLKISRIANPIKEACTLTFEIPQQLVNQFKFHPGQHVILRLFPNGEEVRRSYSINSCPTTTTQLEITVKRVKGGLVSNYLNDSLTKGDSLEVSAPVGQFYAHITQEAYKSYFLFAAGSGITPIISILKTVLFSSPKANVYLLYGNKDQDSILFEKELDELSIQYKDQLTITHTLSSPKVWSTWKQWEGEKGRINQAAIEKFISLNPPIAQQTEYYICGPSSMNASVKKTLLSLQIPTELIHLEQFGGVSKDSSLSKKGIDQAELSIEGSSQSLRIPAGKSILQVLKEHNLNPPYSCESGVCGTCKAKLIEGTIDMASNMALEEKDIKNGQILTCQSVPTSNKVSISFDQ